MKDDSENTREQLYSIAEIALMWRTTVSHIAKVFKREPGVLPVQRRKPLCGIPDRLHQRRIPSSVLERVNTRLHEQASALNMPTSSPAMSASPAPPTPDRYAHQDSPERLFTFNQIAAMWKIGPNNALQLFRDEPGVLEVVLPRFGRRKGHWALYSTPRIPLSVLRRVRERFTRRGFAEPKSSD